MTFPDIKRHRIIDFIEKRGYRRHPYAQGITFYVRCGDDPNAVFVYDDMSAIDQILIIDQLRKVFQHTREVLTAALIELTDQGPVVINEELG